MALQSAGIAIGVAADRTVQLDETVAFSYADALFPLVQDLSIRPLAADQPREVAKYPGIC